MSAAMTDEMLTGSYGSLALITRANFQSLSRPRQTGHRLFVSLAGRSAAIPDAPISVPPHAHVYGNVSRRERPSICATRNRSRSGRYNARAACFLTRGGMARLCCVQREAITAARYGRELGSAVTHTLEER